MKKHIDAAAIESVDTPAVGEESPAGRVQLSPLVRGGMRMAVLAGAVFGAAGATAPHITSVSIDIL